MNLKLNFKKEQAKHHPKLALSFRIRALIQLSLILSVLKMGTLTQACFQTYLSESVEGITASSYSSLLSRWRFLPHTATTAE